MNTPIRPILSAFAFALALSLYPSCSLNLADERLMERATDSVLPAIAVASPLSGSSCANLVEVSGTVSDRVNGGGKGQVASLSFEVPNTPIAGAVPIGEDGGFSFVFDASELLGNFTLSLAAVDWNGNKAIKALPLVREAGNGLPSFGSSAGSKTVSLSWDAVPGTAYYVVYFNADGSIPDADKDPGIRIAPNVTNHTVNGLVNGNVYYFRLRAVAEAGPSSLSDFEKALPLSDRTLCPAVTATADSLILSWAEISATNRFEIWRRTGTDGVFGLYAETTGNAFTDKNVERETWYSYRVRPALEGAKPSQAEWGMLQWFERRPQLVREIDLGDSLPGKIAQEGNRMFVCSSTYWASANGFSVLDISDPANPAFCSRLSVPAIDVAINGSIAYVITGGFMGSNSTYERADLITVDIGDVYAPKVLSVVPIGDLDGDGHSNSWGLAHSGSSLYVAAGTDGIQEFSLGDPGNPAFSRAAGAGTACFTGFTAYGGYGYATCINYAVENYGLVVFDLSDLSEERGLAASALGDGQNFWYPVGTRVITHTYTMFGQEFQTDKLYLMDGQNGVRVFDIYWPDNPQYVYTIDTPGQPRDVRLDGPYLYIADYSGGLQLARPLPENVLKYALDRSIMVAMPGATMGVATSGGYAYVGASLGGVQLVDMNVPETGTAAFILKKAENRASDFSNGFDSLASSGPYAYVANYTELIVADTADPEDVEWAKISLAGVDNFGEICCSGNLMLSDDWGSLAALSLDNPLSPELIGAVDIDGQIHAIGARGDYAYVGGDDGLYIYDISDPSDMHLVRTLKTSSVMGLALEGNYALLYGGAGLSVVDISKPANASVSSVHMYRYSDNSATNVRVSNGWAYATDNYDGLYLFDLGDISDIPAPLAPVNDGTNNGCNFTDALPVGNWTVVLKQDGTKLLYDTANPAAPVFVRKLEGPIAPGSYEFYFYGTTGIVNGKTMTVLDGEGLKVYSLDR